LCEEAARVTGRRLSENAREQLSKYLKILIDWNEVHRVVGSSDPRFIVDRLILDSLLFLRVLPPTATLLVDIGTGAGLPGIPLKIVRPDFELTLVESRRKRASLLSTAIRELELKATHVVHARAEDIVERLAGRFDVAVMRSVGRVERVITTAAKFVRPGGAVVLSGPPDPKDYSHGRWMSVEGTRAGTKRWFLVKVLPESPDATSRS
jgi:16S rRNA (guanine527-N7)-methyltransferase